MRNAGRHTWIILHVEEVAAAEGDRWCERHGCGATGQRQGCGGSLKKPGHYASSVYSICTHYRCERNAVCWHGCSTCFCAMSPARPRHGDLLRPRQRVCDLTTCTHAGSPPPSFQVRQIVVVPQAVSGAATASSRGQHMHEILQAPEILWLPPLIR